MAWKRFIGTLAVVAVTVTVLGALFTLATQLGTGQYVMSGSLVLILVTVSIAASVSSGVRASRFLSNPYW